MLTLYLLSVGTLGLIVCILWASRDSLKSQVEYWNGQVGLQRDEIKECRNIIGIQNNNIKNLEATIDVLSNPELLRQIADSMVDINKNRLSELSEVAQELNQDI